MVSTRMHIWTSYLMAFSACTTPVLDTDAAPMDTDDTASILTVLLANNVPGPFRILPSSGSSEQTSEQTSGADYHLGDTLFILCTDRWSRYHGCLQPVFSPLSS